MTLSPPYIVCAANRHTVTGLVVCGARHFDSVMRAVMKQLAPFKAEGDMTGAHVGWDQGFIDQHGKWYTRTEAWVVAVGPGPALASGEIRGQVKRRVGGDTADGGTLYSEGLY